MISGVDVSVYQDLNTTPQKINFAKMRAAGAQFVFIRCAFGTQIDEDFYDNWNAAKVAGLLRGAYCFWDYRTGAAKPSAQIARWMALLSADPGEMPPAIDVEQPNAKWPALPPSAVVLDTIWQFDNAVRTILKRETGGVLYSNPAGIISRMIPAPAWLTAMQLWVANWYVQPEYILANRNWTLPWKKWTFWQQGLGKGRGPEFGVESLDIDMDYFNGTLEELKTFAGVNLPAPEPEPEIPPEEEKPVGIYDNYPKGAMVTNHAVDPAKLGGDFFVARIGKGLAKNEKFHKHVQDASDAKLPLIAVYDNDPRVMLTQYESHNPDKWHAEIEQNHVITEILKPMIQSGGVNRRIHGLIITMNDIIEPNGNQTDPNWIVDTALAVAFGVWKLFNLPVFFSIDPDVAKKIPHGPKDRFTTFLNGLIAYDPESETGTPGVMEGIATYLNAPVATSGTWANVPAPADSFAETLSKTRMESGLGNAPRTSFWCYSAGAVTMPGMTSVHPMYMYMGSKARLYKELAYTPESSAPTTPTIPPATPDPTLPGTGLVRVERMDELVAALARMEEQNAEILNLLKMRNLPQAYTGSVTITTAASE